MREQLGAQKALYIPRFADYYRPEGEFEEKQYDRQSEHKSCPTGYFGKTLPWPGKVFVERVGYMAEYLRDYDSRGAGSGQGCQPDYILRYMFFDILPEDHFERDFF